MLNHVRVVFAASSLTILHLEITYHFLIIRAQTRVGQVEIKFRKMLNFIFVAMVHITHERWQLTLPFRNVTGGISGYIRGERQIEAG